MIIDRHFLSAADQAAYRIPMWVSIGGILAWVFAGWTIGFLVAIASSGLMIRELHRIAADPSTPFKV